MGQLCDLGHAAYSLPENARSPVLKASLQSAPRLHPGGQMECARSTALRSGSFSARNLKNTNVTARVWWHLRQIKEDANIESQLRAGGWKYVKSVRKTLTPRQNVRQEPEGKNDVNDVGATIHALPIPVDRALAHCQPPVSSLSKLQKICRQWRNRCPPAPNQPLATVYIPRRPHPSGGIILYPSPHLPQD